MNGARTRNTSPNTRFILQLGSWTHNKSVISVNKYAKYLLTSKFGLS